MSERNVVLVVDDDPSVLRGLERLLNAHGFKSEVFNSAAAFRDRANVGDALCVVLDINLNGESGIDLRREIAASGSALPVIFITANDSESTSRAAFEAGCIAYLAKPFRARLLVDAIKRASVETSRLM